MLLALRLLKLSVTLPTLLLFLSLLFKLLLLFVMMGPCDVLDCTCCSVLELVGFLDVNFSVVNVVFVTVLVDLLVGGSDVSV